MKTNAQIMRELMDAYDLESNEAEPSLFARQKKSVLSEDTRLDEKGLLGRIGDRLYRKLPTFTATGKEEDQMQKMAEVVFNDLKALWAKFVTRRDPDTGKNREKSPESFRSFLKAIGLEEKDIRRLESEKGESISPRKNTRVAKKATPAASNDDDQSKTQKKRSASLNQTESVQESVLLEFNVKDWLYDASKYMVQMDMFDLEGADTDAKEVSKSDKPAPAQGKEKKTPNYTGNVNVDKAEEVAISKLKANKQVLAALYRELQGTDLGTAWDAIDKSPTDAALKDALAKVGLATLALADKK